MAKPSGLQTKLKNNDNKHPRVREEWMQGKRIGRKKQVWILDGHFYGEDGSAIRDLGHWEKI